MDLFTSIVEHDNAYNTCAPKEDGRRWHTIAVQAKPVVQEFGDFLPTNALVLGPSPPEVTFRGRNQQQGIRAIVDAYMHYTPTTIDLSQPTLTVSESPKAVGETSLDVRNG